MIGQEKLLQQIDKLIAGGFPRFIILVGARNSGRKLISSCIAKKLDARLITSGIKVEDVREVIGLSYKQSEPTLYLLPDADKMSAAAKNALLKVTEEPPRQAYFIITLQDEQQTLATLRSRGTTLRIDPYTPDDILDYAEQRGYATTQEEQDILVECCTNPGEVDLLVRYNISEFYEFVGTVVENIGTANGANIFKIASKLNFKEDDGGWDIVLFLRTFMVICRGLMDRDADYANEYKQAIAITSRYLNDLSLNGVNKAATIDMWIIDQRILWAEV